MAGILCHSLNIFEGVGARISRHGVFYTEVHVMVTVPLNSIVTAMVIILPSF